MTLIVSITSHPPRIATSWLCIQSIFNQTRKANRVVLYLAAEDFPSKKIPQSLEILKTKGLEVKFSDTNYKVATKLIPALKEFHFNTEQDQKTSIVTVDDDRRYEPLLLEEFWKQHLLHPKDIICPAAREYVFYQHSDPRYSRIDFLNRKNVCDKAGSYIFEGWCGILYPQNALSKEVLNFENFKLLTPCADDIWFQVMAIINGTKTRGLPQRIVDKFLDPKEYDGANATGLWHEHLFGNDWMAYRALKHYGILGLVGIPEIENPHCRTCHKEIAMFSSSPQSAMGKKKCGTCFRVCT